MKPKNIFISYSHQDEKFKDQLIVHLSSLKRRGVIKEWHDRELIAGQEWDGTIKQELIDSDIILLLISADFLASNYCYDVEIKKAMELHEQGNAIVIPIILRPCDWKEMPFSKIQGLPKDAKPISTWQDVDEAYLNIIDGIKNSINIKQIIPTKDEYIDKEVDVITFPQEVIIGRLPRGYLVIQDIEFEEHSSWAVVAHYYDYNGNWRHGTHYHESYHRSWETPEGQDTQCFKLMIQKGDWNIANTALHLIMDIRERQKDESIEDILVNYQGDYEYFEYYKKDEKIPKPVVPEKYVHLSLTGKIRDIVEELSIDSWKNYDIETLHQDFESNRRKAYLILYEKLTLNHPALIFSKEIIDEYKPSYNIDELRAWGSRLSDALTDACKFIRN